MTPNIAPRKAQRNDRKIISVVLCFSRLFGLSFSSVSSPYGSTARQ